jgi:hypothetical protein
MEEHILKNMNSYWITKITFYLETSVANIINFLRLY